MSKLEKFLFHLKEYASLRMRLTELKFSHKSSLLASSLVTISILCILAFTFLLIFSIGISLLIGSYLNQTYWGFLIMAAFYLILGFVLFLFRDKWIRRPMNNL